MGKRNCLEEVPSEEYNQKVAACKEYHRSVYGTDELHLSGRKQAVYA